MLTRCVLYPSWKTDPAETPPLTQKTRQGKTFLNVNIQQCITLNARITPGKQRNTRGRGREVTWLYNKCNVTITFLKPDVIQTGKLKFSFTPSSFGEKLLNSNNMAPSQLNRKHFNPDHARIRKKYFCFLRLCRLQKQSYIFCFGFCHSLPSSSLRNL